MRHLIVLWHRFVGLTIAGFLVVAGLTGTIISWDHELDDLLNPHLVSAPVSSERRPTLDLVDEVERRDPRATVAYFVFDPEPGESLSMFVSPRRDESRGELYTLGYNQIFLDPASGDELGRRAWGAVWPITRETFVSFLYKLHYSLHVPTMWGIDEWGVWLMGVIALVWALDCFAGAYLTLPVRKPREGVRLPAVERALAPGFWARWQPAWRIKTGGSAYRLNFDIHRAFGLWLWALLFIVSFTGFSLNLYQEVFVPVTSTLSKVTPTPFDTRTPTALNAPIEPKLGYREIAKLAAEEAARRGWTAPLGDAFYAGTYGVYGVRFFKPGGDHAAGLGPPLLYLDSNDGRIVGKTAPFEGTAADVFLQAQLPLHSGRILGLPGRILISLMGLAVVAVSITGVVIWHRKRKARLGRPERAASPQVGASPAGAPAPSGQVVGT